MSGNSLQAVLDRAKQPEPDQPKPKATRGKAIAAKAPANQAAPAGRGATKLIGGHFPPEVSAQLRIVAAEEGTTIQNLLAEALDDLFVKKGKARIAGV